MDFEKLDKNMAIKEPDKDLYWYDASALTIEGKGWADTELVYDRLPAKSKDVVRGAVWELSRCAAGLSIQFTSDSPSLSAKWDGCRAMNHMPATGVSGLDLYVRHNGEWRWLAVGRPTLDLNEVQLFGGLPSESRDFMLYLPLYNQIHKVELGIPGGFELQPTAPRTEKPVVFYGTSITQGGCASRGGMCYSAILGRWLDNPVINLGFSGNGIMEPEIFDLLCELDPVMYVLDALPNMTAERVNDFAEDGLRKLCAAHSETPVVLVDNMRYCNSFLVDSSRERHDTSNAAQYAIYEKLVAEGMQNLHYIEDNDLIGTDDEATVDGAHFTDLGYMRFSESLIEPLKKILM